MQLRVLGCSGGIRRGAHTTALMVDDDILIDSGSGVGELELEEMANLRHMFLTHSHLDHIAFLPLLLDSLFDQLSEPMTVYAQPATLQALRSHVFNWVVWPDFTELPSPDRPVVRLESMEPGEVRHLGDRAVEMLPAHHAVPAAGYRIESGERALAFTGDCTTNDVLWTALNARDRLDHLIVEAAFPNEQEELAGAARHYTPRMLGEDLAKLRHEPVIWITHRMPGKEARILEECRRAAPGLDIRPLVDGEVLPLW